MFKKTVTYKDYNGDENTETFWFHLSEAEVTTIEYEAVTNRTLGLVDMIEKIVADMSGKDMIAIIENLVAKSYGVRSTDGKRFMKSDELYAEFKSTGAYSKIFFQLQTDADFLVEWFDGLLPENMVELAQEARTKAGLADAATAEELRRRSEARLQGFKQKEEKVLITKTAPPVFVEESPLVVENANVENTPSARPDLWPDTTTAQKVDDAPADYEAYLAWKAQQEASQS